MTKALVPSPAGGGPNGAECETTLRLGKAMCQMTMQMVLPLEDRGEAPNAERSGEASPAAQGNERSGSGRPIEVMERVVERDNLLAALKKRCWRSFGRTCWAGRAAFVWRTRPESCVNSTSGSPERLRMVELKQ